MTTGSTRFGQLRPLLGNIQFRRLVTSQLLSQLADGVYQVVLASILIFDVSAAQSPAQATKILAVTALPFSLIGPFTGPFIDRFSRRSILVGASLIRAGLTGALALAFAAPEGVLLALTVAVISVNRFFHSTKSAVLPGLVHPDEYVTANAVSTTVGVVFGTGGAVLGAALERVTSARVGLAVGAGLMAGAALVAMTLRLPPGERRGLAGILSELRDDLRDVGRGLRVLGRTPQALFGVSAVWLIRALLGFVLVTALVLLRERFDVKAPGFSFVLAAVGAGGLTAAVVSPALARRLGPGGLIGPAFAVAGLFGLLLMPLRSWQAVLVTAFVSGAAMYGIKVAADALIQGAVEDAFRGRIFAVYDIVYSGFAFILAALIATLVRPLLGDTGMILLTSGMALAAAPLFSRWARRLRQGFEVRAYAGGRADEVPRAVVWEGTELGVAEVERSWNEDRAGRRLLCFRLRLEDGRRIDVSRTDDGWRLDRVLTER